MKKILVTGAAGFIGSHLVESLLAQGYLVYGLDNFDPFYGRGIKEANLGKALAHPNFRFFETDISGDIGLDVLPESVDMVIHLAAKAGVRPSIANPGEYIKHNIIGTENVLQWMKAKEITKLVFASSSSVYGNNTKLPFSETDPVDNPISPYAFTKKACELMNYTFHHLYSMDIINLRLFTAYGERQRPDLAIHKFVKNILAGEPIPVYGAGDSSRDYTYISDIVQGINASVQYLQKNKKVYEIINLGGSHPISLGELIRLIVQLTGLEPKIEHLPAQSGDARATYADVTKAKELLGYNPRVSIEPGLENFINWYKSEFDATGSRTHGK